MSYKESNNSFFSWEGTINRKDYIINMLILTALFFVIKLVRFDILVPEKITHTILMFIVGFLQFVVVMSILSIVYRRIVDFSIGRSYKFRKIMKSIFVIFYVFPILYIYIIAGFISFIPLVSVFLGYLAILTAILGIISSIIFAFIKSK